MSKNKRVHSIQVLASDKGFKVFFMREGDPCYFILYNKVGGTDHFTRSDALSAVEAVLAGTVMDTGSIQPL